MSEKELQPILIVGAGPTGMVLAFWLIQAGVSVRIIDKHAGPGETSRAMVLQARTLEFYQQLGIAEQVVASGIKFEGLQILQDHQLIVNARFGELGTGLSPYPSPLSFPQDEHERLLEAALQEFGIYIEWNTELLSFEDTGNAVQAKLKTAEGEENFTCSYLCGCDGASSTVRQHLGFSFEGGTYEQRFYVADTEVDPKDTPPYIRACLEDGTFCLAFPLRRPGLLRFIGIVPAEHSEQAHLSFADLQTQVESITGIQVKTTNWFSVYQVHHRLAEHFQRGRVFLAGDAGHIHSPAGGQGMNTGIGDAVNLAWKLAAVFHDKASEKLLASYEFERLRFARTLLKTTDQAFTALVGKGLSTWALRHLLLPYLMPKALKSERLKHTLFRTISQIKIEYRDSPLSWSQVGHLESGDRLPWAEQANNYEPLKSRNWQIHIYGEAQLELPAMAKQLDLELYTFTWTDELSNLGFTQDALYVIRPDGHLGLVHERQNLAAMDAYFDHIGYKTHPRPLTI